jgi:hypothetical protein
MYIRTVEVEGHQQTIDSLDDEINRRVSLLEYTAATVQYCCSAMYVHNMYACMSQRERARTVDLSVFAFWLQSTLDHLCYCMRNVPPLTVDHSQ